MQDGSRIRRWGLACAASGVLGIVVGVVTLAYPAAVDDGVWSYPFPFVVALLLAFLLAVIHLLTMVGFMGARQIHANAPGHRAGRALTVAVAGFWLLAACEIASGFIGRTDVDSVTAAIVGYAFGLASLLTALGGIWAAVVLLRRQTPFRRGARAMLASGVVMILLVMPALASGHLGPRTLALMLWSVCFIPLGLNVANAGRARTEAFAGASASS